MPQDEFFTYDDRLFSDLYKEAYGCRPSHSYFERLEAMSPVEKQAEWDDLCNTADAETVRENQNFLAAQREWELFLTEMMMTNGISRADAIRWDMQAYGCADDPDTGYYCFLRHIAYDHEPLINELLGRLGRHASTLIMRDAA